MKMHQHDDTMFASNNAPAIPKAIAGPVEIDAELLLATMRQIVLVVDLDWHVIFANRAAQLRFGSDIARGKRRMCHAISHGLEVPCHETGLECPVRTVIVQHAPSCVIHLHKSLDGTLQPEEITASPIFDTHGKVVAVIEEIRDATELLKSQVVADHMRNELEMLRGLLPTCANCKSIRTEAGTWEPIESFISQRSAAKFSHGICPECVEKLYPDFGRNRR